MKIKKLVFMLLAATSVSGLGANQCYNDPCGYDAGCCPSFLDGVSVYGDYLYWRARKCDLDYAMNYNDGVDTQFSGKVHGVRPDWDSGFRVGLAKECGCWSLDVNYLWFRNSSNDSVTNLDGFLAGTRLINNLTDIDQGAFQYAKGSWRLDYDLVNAVAGYHCCSCGCLDANIFGGFAYAHIDQKFTSLYSETTTVEGAANLYDQATQKWDMDAYGLTFGFKPVYHFNQCFDIFGSFSYSAFAADYERRFTYDQTDNGGVTVVRSVNLRDDCWRISSLVDLSVGLTYSLNNMWDCGFDAALTVGYEFQQWLNNPGFLEFQAESGEFTFDRYQSDLGFDGLFIRLDLGF